MSVFVYVYAFMYMYVRIGVSEPLRFLITTVLL